MTSFKTPTKQQVDTVVQRLRSPEFSAYFFSRLKNPNWITPLTENDLFADPPPTVELEGGDYSFPHWPASRYLVLMAVHSPSDVATVFGKIETNNVQIIRDMIDAALAMPAEIASKVVPAICKGIDASGRWIDYGDGAKLCVMLGEGEEFSAAICLAETLFAPIFEEGQKRLSQREEFFYKEDLKRVVPVLAKQAPKEFLPKICDWFKTMLEVLHQTESGADLSYSWRPAIEDHEQNKDYDAASVMVGHVRETFEIAIKDGGLGIDEAFTYLDLSKTIFKRLRIYLINEFAEDILVLAQQTMLDKELFEDYYCMHEYAMLVGHRLGLLEPDERETWFSWIDAGPTYAENTELFEQFWGRKRTEDDRQNAIKHWKFDRLHWVREHLKDERLAFYQDMLAKHDVSKTADINVWMGDARWRSESPKTLEELVANSFEEVIEFVSSWRPKKERHDGPEIEGLASTFSRYIATHPEKFSKKATLLIDCPVIYVRRFLDQMCDAIKAGQEIDILSVLVLCEWVITRPVQERTTPKQENEGPVDENWQWTRDQISQFIENICKAKNEELPKYEMDGIREILWKIIEILCKDNVQSSIVRNKSKDDPRMYDYLDFGINSARGKAIEAVLEYARWVANHIKETEGEQEVVPGGFEAMPEVRNMLEWQIEPENSSVEVMSIIGSRIYLIYWIDKTWLAANASRLFYLDGIDQSPRMTKGWAAWNSFLVWNRPHIEYYKLFKDQYAYAVNQTFQVQPSGDREDRPLNRLGEHLILLYGRGHISLDDNGGMLRQFLLQAHPDIRRHAISFVGESLQSEEEEIPQDIITRFQKLWEVYWNSVGKQDAAANRNERLFGIWYSCGKFPYPWAIKNFEEFVEVNDAPEPDFKIIELLAKKAMADITRTVRILDKMVHGDRGGWHISSWVESEKTILGYAMKEDGEARKIAERIIDYLGRRGYVEFGELLR